MSLKETNEFLTDVSGVLAEAAIGQTIENKGVRIHRYASSIRVTDLTNAGRLKSMDFSDVLNALKKNGIDYHQYSAMD